MIKNATYVLNNHHLKCNINVYVQGEFALLKCRNMGEHKQIQKYGVLPELREVTHIHQGTAQHTSYTHMYADDCQRAVTSAPEELSRPGACSRLEEGQKDRAQPGLGTREGSRDNRPRALEGELGFRLEKNQEEEHLINCTSRDVNSVNFVLMQITYSKKCEGSS